MASRQDIEQSVHDVLRDAAAQYLDVDASTAASHVALTQRSDKAETPGYVFETFETTVNRGLHGSPHPVDVSYSDASVEIVEAREKNVTVDVTCVSGQDDKRIVNELHGVLDDAFTVLDSRVPSGESLHSDVVHGSLTVDGVQQNNSVDEGFRGDRFRVSFNYVSRLVVTTDVLNAIEYTVEELRADDELIEYYSDTV